ncbi:MAG: nucleotidyltransferase domain-containing protein [Sphingobium sp.]|uniref:nucleotidyltransferase family protein n=1 Tax=Sphingobium sp. TaxID=1912891 RepID=UPI002E237B2F
MTREEAIARLKPHEAELRAAGIRSLALFGSVARGEAREDSDVDLMCEIDHDSGIDLIAFAGLQLKLQHFMRCSVDLVERGAMRPRIRASAETDMVPVF